MLEAIQKTREYLDYIEEHYNNVQKAFKVVEEKCKDMQIIYDDYYYHTLRKEVELHDLSKLSVEEFVQYRKSFFPTKWEEKCDLGNAWEHHKIHNPHHWENWTNKSPRMWEVHCTHMVIDWMAMGYKFGDTAEDYYESKRENISLPDYALNFIYQIFERIRDEKEDRQETTEGA